MTRNPRPQQADRDRRMMALALSLARRKLGTTAPNPSVGALVADAASGRIIACGVTQPGGRPHAEAVALARAGQNARGATLYVTLEPCSHHGRTPPCADLVIASGIGRVVSAIEDANPAVSGRGHARIRAAGIELVTDVLAEAARRVNLGHLLCQTERRPAVTVKMALDAAGEVPRGAGGRARIVTGRDALRRAHFLRAHYDAILIGGGTLRDDDPELTCRLPGLEYRSPVRIVVTGALDAVERSRLLGTVRKAPLWLVTSTSPAPAQRARLETAGAVVIPAPAAPGGGIAPRTLLALLCARGITRLLVEGGPAIWRAFFTEDLVDEATVFWAGHGARAPLLVPALAAYGAAGRLELIDHRDLGADRMFRFAGAAAGITP